MITWLCPSRGRWSNRAFHLIIDFMKIKFDVLYNERFVKTFVYENKSPLPPSEGELRDFVVSKLPTFKNKDFKIHLY